MVILNDRILPLENKVKNFESYFWMNYGFTIPTNGAISTIIDFTKGEEILEVGAGLGLWAYILQNRGQRIIPTDSWASPEYNVSIDKLDENVNFGGLNDFAGWEPSHWTDIETIDAEGAVEKYYKHKILMMIWPTKEKWTFNALEKFEGDKFIYIGDGNITGIDEFHDSLSMNWELVEFVDLPNFNADPALYLYRRKDG